MVVLDAWPVVEYYAGNDPSASEVETLLSDYSTAAVMSAVNHAEVYSAIATNAHDFSVASHFMASLRGVVSVVEPSPEVAELAALVKHCYHMSLGDCFAVATAISLSSDLWFTQTEWNTGSGSASLVELWTGDCELICENRVWNVRDLRTSETQLRHATAVDEGRKKAGFRAGTQKGFSMLVHPSGPVLAAQASSGVKLH